MRKTILLFIFTLFFLTFLFVLPKNSEAAKPNDCTSNLAVETYVSFTDNNSGTTWGVKAIYRGDGPGSNRDFNTGWDFYRTDGGAYDIRIGCYRPQSNDEVEWQTSCVDPVYPVHVSAPGCGGGGGFFYCAYHDYMDVTCRQGQGGIYRACDNPNNKGFVGWGERCPGTPDCAKQGKLDVCNDGQNYCGGNNNCDLRERYCNFNNSFGNWCDSRQLNNNAPQCGGTLPGNWECGSNNCVSRGCPGNQNCVNHQCVTPCNCGNWQDQTCGGGSCGPNQRRQTRNCNPNGCQAESRCVQDNVCERGPIGGTIFMPGGGRYGENAFVIRNNVNNRDQSNNQGDYSFGGLPGGSIHDITLSHKGDGLNLPGGNNNKVDSCVFVPQSNDNTPWVRQNVQVPNNNVNFQLNNQTYTIRGKLWWDPDGSGGGPDREPYVNQGNIPGKNVRVRVAGQGSDLTDGSLGRNNPQAGRFAIGGIPTNPGGQDFTVSVDTTGADGIRPTHNVVGGNTQPARVTCNDVADVDFNIAPDGYDISGTIYVDDGDGVLDPGAGATRDQPYTGSYGAQIATVTVDGTRSDNIDNSGRYLVAGNPNGSRSVRLNVNSLRPAYRNIVTPPGNPRIVAVSGSDRANINFLIVRTPPTTWSLSGGLFIDTDPTRQRNGESYTTPLNPEHIEINGRRLNNGNFPGSTFDAAGFYVPDLAAGVYDVTFPTPVRQNFVVSYHPGRYRITLGNPSSCPLPSTCNSDGDAEGIDFGISDNPAPQGWIQSVGGDFRWDRDGFVNIIPIAGGPNICGNTSRPYVSSNSVVNGNLSSGIVFTGTLPQFVESGDDQPSKAAPNRWLLTGDTFTPARPNTIKTSYAYVKAAVDKGGIDTNQMFNDACSGGGGNCNLKGGIVHGVYLHTGTVILRGGGTYTFPDGQDYVFLIDNGNLNINTNIDVPPGSTVMFIVNGNITVANSVDQIEGIFSANGNFTFASGATTTPLVVEGSVIANAGYSSGEILPDRDLGAGNATCPAVRVVSRPDFILNGPELLRFPVSIISEVAPQGGN